MNEVVSDSVLDALVAAWTDFVNAIGRHPGMSRQALARFSAGAAAGAARAAGYSWEEFEEHARRGWQAAADSGGKSS